MRKSNLPPPKYRTGTRFRHIDTEETYILSEVRFDTYVLVGNSGLEKGESLFTLEYDYELVKEGEALLYGKK